MASLIRSPSEATEACAKYAAQMEGDELEVFHRTLPQLMIGLFGDVSLGGSGGVATNHAWLNEQANLLVEPRRNVRHCR